MLSNIEHAFDERERSQVRLRQFVADASHELRTPVTTIRGYAELYRTGALGPGPSLDDAMRRTEQESIRMGSLVDDLLHLARLDQGRPLERHEVRLGRLIDDAVRDTHAVEPARVITADIVDDVVVLGDESRLRQVIGNLVTNARIHTSPTSPIVVRVRRDGNSAVVEVIDEGPGMTPEAASRAFERFYRSDPSRSRARGGSGLGLSIVEATVDAHNGSVSLASSPDQGTTVTVRLPLQAASSD
jgi:two-component system OmpR family sensor kinase